ncbi:MAG: hypothetical protein AB1801_10065 [Chloroflexota bacterium]
MPKQNRAAETKSDQKSRPKLKPSLVEELTDDVAGLAQLPGSPVAAVGDGTIQTQAAWLGNPRLQNTQRQAMAAQIGRVQGNGQLQRVVASMKGEGERIIADDRYLQDAGNSRTIQLSPLSEELRQLWNPQSKGPFFNRLRSLNRGADADTHTFVRENLSGDDRWLAQNLLTYGPEANWPIHLKVEREMKGWGDSGGKGAVFELLRNANGSQTSNVDLANTLNRVFAAGSDDIWLALNLQYHGREAQWPIHLRVEREMKGWSNSGGKGVVFDLLRAANGAEAGNANLTASLNRVFAAGSDDIWLAQNLQAHGPEANWPIHLQVEREMKGWSDSGGIAEVINLLPLANAAERQHILSNAALMGRLRNNASQAQFLQIMLLLVDVTSLPAGPIQNATALLAGSEHEVDRNTAQRLLNGDTTAYYMEDLSQPPNVNDLVTGYGLDPTVFTIYLEPPGNTAHMIVQTNAQGFRRRGTSKIFGLRSLSLSRWQTVLVHETNHARNPDPTTPVERYKSEFRAYWVAEYRGVADLDQRAREIKTHILRDYPQIKAPYDSNRAVKRAIDAHTRPEGNVTNI